MNAPTRSDAAITKKALIATRRARDLLVAMEARLVMLRNTSADPGGLTTGKSAASTRRKVSIPFHPAHACFQHAASMIEQAARSRTRPITPVRICKTYQVAKRCNSTNAHLSIGVGSDPRSASKRNSDSHLMMACKNRPSSIRCYGHCTSAPGRCLCSVRAERMALAQVCPEIAAWLRTACDYGPSCFHSASLRWFQT